MFAPRSRAAALLLGWCADLVFADPRRAHPVAGFGAVVSAAERVVYRDARWSGMVYVGTLVTMAAIVGTGLQRASRMFGLAGAIWVVLGGTSLLRTVSNIAERLTANDIDGARNLLPSLCGRDPDALDREGLIRAALESLAENTSDAHTAPLFWAAVGGAPGALAYRAVNTLDAMIGYRTPRYTRFGWAAARLDDLANILPARMTAALVVVCAPFIGGSSTNAIRFWRRDAGRHPSPNAGVAEAAFAGALSIRLGGPTRYPHGLEIRPTLGDGSAPDVDDLRRAIRLSWLVQIAAVVVTLLATHRRRKIQ